MALDKDRKVSLKQWIDNGDPFIWANGSAVTISVLAVIGLLALLAVRGFSHFWPANVVEVTYSVPGEAPVTLIGEVVETEAVSVEQLESAGFTLTTNAQFVERNLVKRGNRDLTGADFVWVIEDYLGEPRYPVDVMTVERREWGNFYGYPVGLRESGQPVQADDLWAEIQNRIGRALQIHDNIEQIEKVDIGAINYSLERLRLRTRELDLRDSISPRKKAEALADIAAERQQLDARYSDLQQQLVGLYEQINRDTLIARAADGREVELPLAKIVHAIQPNNMGVIGKALAYVGKFWEFLTDDPREANTEGGIFPAIFGTVMMVLLMSVIVTPFGVVAAVYLREYAKQGIMTRTVRIAVNNLAGVPSIVYGVFGLGFFIYFLGAEIDKVLFEAALPAPTFGTPGLLWASLTLALLTLPVVIVATEEGLARIPRTLREGSLALGATKAETLWRIVLPMASPAMMTGLILAVARAAGEVAPLMLVGVVKLAPSLPLDGNYPYLHLDQKFMHLGFHIYDVGFQSPNVEAARPLVYATALLLVIIIALLNLSAVALRNHLRERYKSLEM